MSKNTNLSFLTDYITADITNGRIGINNASPTVAFDVVGATKITGVLTLTSTISNGTYTYTLPSATGTLALTSALSGYLPLTGGTLTGALGGTSASFTGVITTANDVNLTSSAYVYSSAGGSGVRSGIFLNGASQAFNVFTAGTSKLEIASTGAATFSGIVNIGTAGTERLNIFGAGSQYINIKNTTTSADMFVGMSSGLAAAYIGTGGTDPLVFVTVNTERMRITSAGNVGIGNTNPNSLLTLKNSATNTRLELDTESAGSSILSYDRTASAYKILYLRGSDIQINPNDVTAMTIKAGGNILIGTTTSNNHKLEIVSGSTSAIRVSVDSGTSGISMSPGAIFQIDKAGVGGGAFQITSGGNVLINQSVTDASAGGAVFQLTQGNANWIHFIKNSNTSGNVYGSNILFSYAPNNTASAFFGGSDSSTERYRMYANGGLANYATNNVVLSDERLKKDITPLESVWNKIKNIEIVKYKFKDQTHDDFNMGVIAQQVEKIAPELIEIDGWGTLAEDGSTYKGIYETDINYYSIKALQEAMAKIEILESEITILKNK